MPSALVTGCAGFIGSHLSESLLHDGFDVLGVDCFNDNYPRADKLANLAHASEHDRFRLITADLASLDALQLLDGIDVVFHLAGEPGVRASWGPRFDRYTHHNVQATQRLLEAARGTGVRFVYASSSSVYGDAMALPTREDATPARTTSSTPPRPPPRTRSSSGCRTATTPSWARRAPGSRAGSASGSASPVRCCAIRP